MEETFFLVRNLQETLGKIQIKEEYVAVSAWICPPD